MLLAYFYSQKVTGSLVDGDLYQMYSVKSWTPVYHGLRYVCSERRDMSKVQNFLGLYTFVESVLFDPLW